MNSHVVSGTPGTKQAHENRPFRALVRFFPHLFCRPLSATGRLCRHPLRYALRISFIIPSGQNPDKTRTSQRNPLQHRHLPCPDKFTCPALPSLWSLGFPSPQNRKKPERNRKSLCNLLFIKDLRQKIG